MAAYTGWLGILHAWQDLAGALVGLLLSAVAVGISYFALRATRDQVDLGRRQINLIQQQDADRRRSRTDAMRAALNATLSSVCGWADAMANALCDLPVSSKRVAMSGRETFLAPLFPPADLQVLVQMIEATDNIDVQQRLNRLVSNLQVLAARASLIPNRRKGIGLMKSDLDIFILDAAIIYAQASSCFDYARRVKDTVPTRLSWTNIDNAMMSLSLHGPRYAEIVGKIRLWEEADQDPERIHDRV